MSDDQIRQFVKENRLRGEEKSSFDFHFDRFNQVIKYLKEIYSMKNKKNPKLLDVCSGPLHLSSISSLLGFKVYALDLGDVLNSKRIKQRAKHYNITLNTCNLAKEPIHYRGNSFDVATMFEALEHFNFNPVPIIKEIHRVMRPRGIFVLTTPNLFRLGNKIRILFNKHEDISIEHPVVGHWREYSGKEISKLMELGGFKKYKITYFNYYIPRNNKIVKLLKKIMTFIFPSLSGDILVIAEK